jgi:DNA-binding NarL/FixJ family response regulator
VQPLDYERPQPVAYDEGQSIAWTGASMKQIRVLIVDEHLAVRRALAARLKAYGHIDVVATARDFHGGLELARDLRPDVILLELKGASNLQLDPVGEMTRALSGHPAGIIVLTSYADDDEREAALRAGARRYLLKQIDTARLLDEIEAVATEVSGQVN